MFVVLTWPSAGRAKVTDERIDMAKRKLTALAQALVLVDGLSAEEQATLSDYLRGKLQPRPKSTAQSAGKRSSKKSAEQSSTANTLAQMGAASGVSGD